MFLKKKQLSMPLVQIKPQLRQQQILVIKTHKMEQNQQCHNSRLNTRLRCPIALHWAVLSCLYASCHSLRFYISILPFVSVLFCATATQRVGVFALGQDRQFVR